MVEIRPYREQYEKSDSGLRLRITLMPGKGARILVPPAGPHFVLPKARLAEELARSGESFNKF